MPGILGITASGVDTTTTVDVLTADDIILPAVTVSEPTLVEGTLDLDIEIVRATVTTGTGTQDFTASGFGTAKGAIFIASDNQSDAQVQNQGTGTFHTYGIGFTDGTNDRVLLRQIEDNTTAVNGNSALLSTACAGIYEYATENAFDALSFDSWVTDGVRLSKATHGISRTFLLTVVLIKGGDFDMAVGDVDANGTISGLGFKPNVLLGCANGSAVGSSVGAYRGSTGFAWDTGAGTTYANQNMYIGNGTNPSSANSEFNNQFLASQGTGTWESTVSSWDSGGATLSSTDTDDVIYAAMRFGGGVYLGFDLCPTSTGNASKTGLSFQPGFLMTLSGDVATGNLNVHHFAGEGFPWQCSVTDGTNEYLHGVGAQDNTSPQTAWSVAAQRTALCYDHTGGTKQYEATLVSLDAAGWTENWTTVPGTAQYTLRFAVET
jgi:hypothetical protein